MTTPEIRVPIQQIGEITVAAISGELNGRSAPAVQEKLLPLVAPGCKILLDMRDVSYMSSAGLRILLLLYRQIAGQQGHVVLSGLPDAIRDTMAITGFLDFFEDYDTRPAAMAALQARA